MSTEALLRQAVRGALAVGAAGSMVGAGAALAQTAPAAGTAGSTTKLSNIVVTGSHISQAAIATSQPVLTINRQQIENTGLPTVGDILQNLSTSGAALNTLYNNGGSGAVLENLHNLGSQRVLILVNGQRWTPTLFGAVDLSTIPSAVVDQVQILLNGASAVYGSEAIAGVINIITRQDYNGATASAYFGEYDGHGGGLSGGGGWDGRTQRYSFTVGTSGDRSSVLFSAGYYEQNAVWAADRNISKEPYLQGGQTYGSSNTPYGRYLLLGIPAFGQAQNPGMPGCSDFSPSTSAWLCDTSGPFGAPVNGHTAHPWSNADRYNYAPLNYYLTPSERYYTFAQGHYDLSDNVTFKFMSTYQRRNSHQVLAPNPWALGLFGYTANGLPIGVSRTNIYNPYGMDLVPAYPSSTSLYNAWCSKFGTGGGGTCGSSSSLLLIGWRPLTSGVRDFNQNQSTFYLNSGFDGYFQVGGNEWNWYSHYIFGTMDNTTVTHGLADTARIQNALGPNSACQSLPGCVPLDMFHSTFNQTPDQLNYVSFTAHDVTDVTMRDYNAGLSGSFWNSWYAGPWNFAAGYEYDELDGFSSPDPLISEGNTVGNVTQPTVGRENTNAQYVELVVPFANNAPFAKELSVDLANRWSQFKWNGVGTVLQGGNVVSQSAGGRAHASTGRVTLKWRPISQLLFRGSWSQGFRIPSLSELFFGASDSYPGAVDPCATTFGGTGGSNCPGPNGFGHTQQNAQIKSTVGGNVALNPEKSLSRSIGFVYSPTWAEGLDFSADYYKVEVDGFISRHSAQYYLNSCYAPLKHGFSAPSGCDHIVVHGNSVYDVITLNANLGSIVVRGWDLGLRYKLPTTSIGDFTLTGSLNFDQSDVTCSTSGCFENSGSSGSFGAEPKHKMNLGLDWNYGPWAAVWNMTLIGPVWEDCANAPFAVQGTSGADPNLGNWCSNPEKYVNGQQVGQNHLGTVVYHDVNASYTVASWNTTFTLGINNLFDKAPPVARTAFANSTLPMYRLPGRFFYGRVTVNF